MQPNIDDMESSFDHIVSRIDNETDDPKKRLEMAQDTCEQLRRLGDRVVVHFVEQCRSDGMSWAEIGEQLGFTRQAAQKRFVSQTRVTNEAKHGKYDRLQRWLAEQKGKQFSTTFGEIESVLGFSLPASSRRHLAHWYSLDGSAVTRAIAAGGWRSTEVDIKAETLTFIRR